MGCVCGRHRHIEPFVTGYEDEMKEFWELEMKANVSEARLEDGPELRLYTEIMSSKCKNKTCTGKPKLMKLDWPTRFGKRVRIGCTGWRRGDAPDLHRKRDLDRAINEDIFVELFENDGKLKEDRTVNGNCSVIAHYRSHQTICPYSHVINGQVKVGKIVPYNRSVTCSATLVIYQPVESALSHLAVVVPKNCHNHPRHQHAKPTVAEQQLFDEVYNAASGNRVTPKALQSSSTTAHILKGKSWGTALPGLTDDKRVRREVEKKRRAEFPEGEDWAGVQAEANRQAKLPVEQRYIHQVTTKNDMRLVVTMLPSLIRHLHNADYLAIDYTFKRVRGDMNEWEIATYLEGHRRRVTLASLYCNRATRYAFSVLFQEFFDTVKHVTGKSVTFFAFDKTSPLRCLIFDAEAAQMQGCGDVLLRMNEPEISGIDTSDPLVLVQYIAKTCLLHFLRNIDELPKDIPRDVINRLKDFPNLSSHEEIEDWKNFCRTSEHKRVQDWFGQKCSHPWFLPSVNAFLSPMDPVSFKITPNNTNVAESAHAARNARTGIGLSLLGAITQAYRDDLAMAQTLNGVEIGAHPDRWGGTKSRREQQARNRRAASERKNATINEGRSQYDDLNQELEDLKSQKQLSLTRRTEIMERLKAIAIEKKNHSKLSTIHASLSAESQSLKAEQADGINQRQLWGARLVQIKEAMKTLEQNELKGARVSDSRPSSSTPHSKHPSEKTFNTPATPASDSDAGVDVDMSSLPEPIPAPRFIPAEESSSVHGPTEHMHTAQTLQANDSDWGLSLPQYDLDDETLYDLDATAATLPPNTALDLLDGYPWLNDEYTVMNDFLKKHGYEYQ